MLERLCLSHTCRPLDVLLHWAREGHLELSPSYQRGLVWCFARRRNLIRSILLGVPIPSLIVNDRFSAGWDDKIAVIDGKQRIYAILSFLRNELSVPGSWFGLSFDSVFFSELPLPMQRRFRNFIISVSEGQLQSLDAECEVFDLVNFGGIPYGEIDPEV